ncbi:MAG: L-lactate permease [Dorea sp.]
MVAILLALTYWKMPVKDCVTGGLEGVAMAIWPVSLVIAAVFTYNLCIETGSMEKIKKVLTGVSKDRRILPPLIGWGFGGFLEGMAGFGTAVAIPAEILCGIRDFHRSGDDPLPGSKCTPHGGLRLCRNTDGYIWRSLLANITGKSCMGYNGAVITVNLN